MRGMDPKKAGLEPYMEPDVWLTEESTLPIADARLKIFTTSKPPEALCLVERHGGILIACDSLQNMTGPDEYFDERSAAMMEAQGFFHAANVGPGWRNAAKPEASDFTRLKAMEFRHLVSAHGEPLLDDAQTALGATFTKLYGI